MSDKYINIWVFNDYTKAADRQSAEQGPKKTVTLREVQSFATVRTDGTQNPPEFGNPLYVVEAEGED